jgi:hypothetical protein
LVANLAALAFFVGLSLAFFGPKILPHLHDRVFTGRPGDWGFFVWALEWWPHAIGHGLNPLFTHDLWHPSGINLAWTTVAPTPSLMLAPITSLFGPVAAFDVASLLAPAAAAWTAFLLFSRLTRRAFAPSLAGGFVFGFSPYLMAQLVSGHLNLSLVLMVPICTYLVVCRLQDSLSPRRFVALMSVCLVVQFGISTEVFATMAAFGFAVGAIGWFVAPVRERPRVLAVGGWLVLSYAAALVVVSPYLYAMFAYPEPYKPLFSHPLGPILVGDLPRLLVPGKTEILGLNFGQPGTDLWYFHLERYGWYVPLPLLAITVHLWMTQRRRPAVKVAVAAFVCGLVLAIGPSIKVGTTHLPLPWTLVQALPLIGRALPYRMMAYAALALGACVAYWLASAPRSWRRWSVFALGGFLLLPNIGTDLWTREVTVPPFFTTGQYRQFLSPGEVVWIVDLDGGRQMLWQTDAQMYFRLSGGYTGVTPPGLADPGTEYSLVSGHIRPQDAAAIKAFVTTHDVGAVIVGDEPPAAVTELSRDLGVDPVRTGGVVFYRLHIGLHIGLNTGS